MYDVIVVGARCAGSPLAMLLARKGYRVLLVDRSRFPSDITSTHYIHQPGVAYLKNWGLLDGVIATNCPPIPGMYFDVGPFAIEGTAVPCGDVSVAVCPRRKVLDRVLFEAPPKLGLKCGTDATSEVLSVVATVSTEFLWRRLSEMLRQNMRAS